MFSRVHEESQSSCSGAPHLFVIRLRAVIRHVRYVRFVRFVRASLAHVLVIRVVNKDREVGPHANFCTADESDAFLAG